MKKFSLIFCLLFTFLLPVEASAEPDVVKEVFLKLNQDYVGNLSNKEIALRGLKSLSKISPTLSFQESAENLVLYKNGKPAKTYAFPTEKAGVENWSDFCNNIIKEASEIDETLETHDFELTDKFAAAVFETLDNHSHYFGAFEAETDEPLKIRRPFASYIDNKILIIKILSFKKDTANKVQTAVQECSKCEGIVLDLRGNHGGFLDEALKIASLFLDEGIITYTLSPQNDSPDYYTAEKGDISEGKPMVILTDGNTASAAEILAAALSEQNRATLIGTKTYGKGTVQDVMKMDADRAMAFTTAYFYTPSGIKIDQIGLTPFICTTQDENCAPADRFNKQEDIDLAVKYLKTGSTL